MAARAWRRAGWGLFAAAVVGVAGYMLTVGWDKASLIAGVGGFFVGIAGLVIAVRPPARGGVQMRMHKVSADGTAAEIADVPAGTPVFADMDNVTGRSAHQWIRARPRPGGAGDAVGRDD